MINEKRYERIEGDYIISGGVYNNENGDDKNGKLKGVLKKNGTA